MNPALQPAIKSLIVRLHHGSLILPVNLMAELVTGGELTPSEHPGLEGWLQWRNRQIPVVSLESLCMQDAAGESDEGKCLILHTVSALPALPFIALRVQGGLNTLDILPDTLRDDHSGNVQRCPYVARQVRASHLLCFIPDLPTIEAVVAEVLQLTAEQPDAALLE
ncbi:chemotaxis protein CheW [Thiothrix subterranea]|uniref:Chemotaxis protein CheW n=1 Tax=Thiothrix subterranea TaxID=2735563 RepID=A0AA51MSG3_9GAMM|nr:chemotaxis protein CheW [Thiothrix subterranea]MDQ5770513.1 chemotaxis protein CheW [Thiothrix subterranea]QQZ29202.1 chemotaxis protein CheW [Thiothrix subterranea]WML87481.1 chemotaxis protein CheW [Thiothrix subterranea]